MKKNHPASSEFEASDKCPSCGAECNVLLDLDEQDYCNECREEEKKEKILVYFYIEDPSKGCVYRKNGEEIGFGIFDNEIVAEYRSLLPEEVEEIRYRLNERERKSTGEKT